jgi:hypothetical protein
MRRIACAGTTAVACLVVATGVPSTQVSTEFRDTHAQSLVQAARTAVGRGPRAIEELRSLVMRGTSRVAVDDGAPLVSGEVEIRILLPRHALRIDRSGTAERVLGLAGRDVLSVHRDVDVREEPPLRLHNDILRTQRAWFGRLLLGSAAYVSPDLSVVFRGFVNAPSETTGELLDGTRGTTRAGLPDPNIVEASGRDGFHLRLVLDTGRFPQRLEYHFGRSGSGTMQFEDRREAGGLMLPHRITTFVAGRLVDELVFDEIRVNVPLSAADFTKEATLAGPAGRRR